MHNLVYLVGTISNKKDIKFFSKLNSVISLKITILDDDEKKNIIPIQIISKNIKADFDLLSKATLIGIQGSLKYKHKKLIVVCNNYSILRKK